MFIKYEGEKEKFLFFYFALFTAKNCRCRKSAPFSCIISILFITGIPALPLEIPLLIPDSSKKKYSSILI